MRSEDRNAADATTITIIMIIFITWLHALDSLSLSHSSTLLTSSNISRRRATRRKKTNENSGSNSDSPNVRKKRKYSAETEESGKEVVAEVWIPELLNVFSAYFLEFYAPNYYYHYYGVGDVRHTHTQFTATVIFFVCAVLSGAVRVLFLFQLHFWAHTKHFSHSNLTRSKLKMENIIIIIIISTVVVVAVMILLLSTSSLNRAQHPLDTYSSEQQ